MCSIGFIEKIEHAIEKHGGSGLGLSIASMIVNSHGGTIRAMHNNPKGTIFVIRLPR